MEERYIEEDVRKRLILAGLDELCEHGIRDFSLRRVALCANVSCAAPYRHFKDKGELIGGIIDFIFSKWHMLCETIVAAFPTDKKRLAVELSVASIRFWIANGNFRTVLLSGGGDNEAYKEKMAEFDTPIIEAVEAALREAGHTDEKISDAKLTVGSLIYGSVMLISTGRTSGGLKSLDAIKKRIERELS